ncbi:MAG: VOC family protein [Candidatus Coatesbacteria bacterium]|nr:VOC family protein [Candidatus Coatesbacteria bacterium]
MSNIINAFDLPVADLKRAIKFYEKILDCRINLIEEEKMAVVEYKESEVVCCLIQCKNMKSSKDGVLLYFNVTGRLDYALQKAREFNCTVITEKHQIGMYGYKAVIIDTEGNRIALHSF